MGDQVKRGQIYKARARLRQKHVMVVGLRRGLQPIATVKRVSKSGRRIGRKDDIIRVFLTWDGTQWVMPPGYEFL
jgi:hypothetical protein